jgi:hypothetical protein
MQTQKNIEQAETLMQSFIQNLNLLGQLDNVNKTIFKRIIETRTASIQTAASGDKPRWMIPCLYKKTKYILWLRYLAKNGKFAFFEYLFEPDLHKNSPFILTADETLDSILSNQIEFQNTWENFIKKFW